MLFDALVALLFGAFFLGAVPFIAMMVYMVLISIRYSASEWRRAFAQGFKVLHLVKESSPETEYTFWQQFKSVVSFAFSDYGRRYDTIEVGVPGGTMATVPYNGRKKD